MKDKDSTPIGKPSDWLVSYEPDDVVQSFMDENEDGKVSFTFVCALSDYLDKQREEELAFRREVIDALSFFNKFPVTFDDGNKSDYKEVVEDLRTRFLPKDD